MELHRYDRLLIVLLGAAVILTGIDNTLTKEHHYYNIIIHYQILVVYVSILCWRIYVSCAELRDMEDQMQQDIDANDEMKMERKKRKRKQIQRTRNKEVGEAQALLHASNLQSNWTTNELDLLGVSVHHLQHFFLKEVHDAGLTNDATIYEIENIQNLDDHGIVRRKGANVKCPIDSRQGAAYVHSIILDEDDDEKQEDHFGKAQIMLSYTWCYSIGDIIECLVDLCMQFGMDPKRTYVWICVLCVNQHRVAEMKKRGERSIPFDTFGGIFSRRVKEIGHLVPMISPWTNPIYLTRVWCLFELIIAKKLDCRVTMVMPARERREFLRKMIVVDDGSNMSGALEAITQLFEVLSNTKVQDAEASEESDRTNILKMIETSRGGYTSFNAKVNELIRKWVIQILKNEVGVRSKSAANGSLSCDDLVSTFRNVGNILSHIGEKRDALEMYRGSKSICDIMYGSNHANTALTMKNVACAMSDLGQFNEALQIYQEVLSIEESLYGRKHGNVASTMTNMAVVMSDLGQYEEALHTHQEVLSIQESLYGRNHAHTAVTIMNMAVAISGLGRKEEALQTYQEVFSIQESLYGRNHADTASIMMNMACAMSKLGEKEKALKTYQEVFSIQESLYGRNHPSVALTMYNMAVVMFDLGQKEESLRTYREALSIQESLYGRNHVSIARTMMGMATTMSDLGQKEECLQTYEELLSIQESLNGGRNHADTARTMMNMANVLFQLGRKEEALHTYQKVLTIQESLYGKNHTDTARTMHNMGILMSQLGRKKESLQMLKESLAVLKLGLGRDHPYTAATKKTIKTISKNF